MSGRLVDRKALARVLLELEPGTYEIPGVGLSSDRAADVRIVVRRVAAGWDAWGETRDRAIAELKIRPWAACECGVELARKRSFYRPRCHKRPTVAVEFKSGFNFVCASHARRFVDQVQVMMPADVLAEARRETERRQEKADAERRQAERVDDFRAKAHAQLAGGAP